MMKIITYTSIEDELKFASTKNVWQNKVYVVWFDNSDRQMS